MIYAVKQISYIIKEEILFKRSNANNGSSETMITYVSTKEIFQQKR